MKRRRGFASGVDKIAGRLRRPAAANREADNPNLSQGVEPGEIALILLKNALRLLDQSMAPREIRDQINDVISELEEFMARRAR